jgi:hypothetical protein
MLCDAFPAEKSGALRTACNSLPLHMIVTALVSDISHKPVLINPAIFVNYSARKQRYDYITK